MDSIPARCRDENGYLVRQSLMTDVPYGRRTVARAGCGFLAVYNAARFFGLRGWLRRDTGYSVLIWIRRETFRRPVAQRATMSRRFTR